MMSHFSRKYLIRKGIRDLNTADNIQAGKEFFCITGQVPGSRCESITLRIHCPNNLIESVHDRAGFSGDHVESLRGLLGWQMETGAGGSKHADLSEAASKIVVEV